MKDITTTAARENGPVTTNRPQVRSELRISSSSSSRDRYERGSLLITTNQVVSQSGVVFGDDVLAVAILDRILHHSHTLMIPSPT